MIELLSKLTDGELFWLLVVGIISSYLLVQVIFSATEKILRVRGDNRVRRTLAEKGINPYAQPFCATESDHLDRGEDDEYDDELVDLRNAEEAEGVANVERQPHAQVPPVPRPAQHPADA